VSINMSATEETTATGESASPAATGRVARVIGPVVDVEFATEEMPEIYNALHVDVTLGDTTRTLTLEIEQHLGDDTIRAISMQPTDGLVRGAAVTDTGGPITVPVGDVTKGHVFNVLGEPLDVPASDLEGHRALVHPPQPAAVRPARGAHRDPGDRDQGA
jgi:F-type H+-transporting ATPase subunit beta